MGNVEINRGAMLAFDPPSGPFVMVNLLRFKDKSKFHEFNIEMMKVAKEAFVGLAAENLYSGDVLREFIGLEDHWHGVALVRYPSWPKLCDTLADDDLLRRLNEVRRTYLDDSRFMLTRAHAARPSG